MTFRRRIRVAALMLLGVGGMAASSPAGEAARRPNVVFLLLDDVRYDDVVGHPFAALPHLDRLRREGASFTRFFTAAPLCSPSRAVFLTGLYPHRNGIIDNGERAGQSHRLVTFPRLLREAGYRTGFFGKWHMGHEDDSPRPGFDRWVSFVGQGVYFDPTLNVDGKVAKASGYITDLLTNEAVAFIRSAPAGQPFLVFLSQKAVHPEVHPNQVRSFPSAPGDTHLYEGATVPHGPAWRAPTTGKPALELPGAAPDPRSPPGGLPDALVQDRLRMLAAVDRGIGALRAALEARGVLEETVFIVTSDQGFFYGEFGLAQERRLAYEPSIRIPFIVRYPGLAAAGSEPSTLACNADVAPTLLALGGAAVPPGLDGRSLLPAFRDPSAVVRGEFFLEYYSDREFPRLQRLGYKAIRTARHKYIRYEELSGMDELYDLAADPHELDNLLPGRVPREVRLDLEARLNREFPAARAAR